MTRDRRSGCPISYSLDLFGDRWTLLILRDMVLGGKRYYRDFLAAPERIATNVLAERLARLERAGLIDKRRDPEDRKRNLYTLTEAGLDTIPILLEVIVWGATHDADTAAPRQFIERALSDRDEMIAELRSKALRS